MSKIISKYGLGGFRFQASEGSVDGRKEWDAYLRTRAQELKANNTVEQHTLFAYQIVEPLKTVADYVEWTGPFFHTESASLFSPHRFANNDGGYTNTSWVTSPDGSPRMIRPGRTTFEGVLPTRYTTGLELDLDQLEAAGWDLASRKIEEAGFELGRRRDSVRKTLIDAAVTATGGSHVATVSTSMTYASFRSIVQSSVGSLYYPTFCVINPKRLWDMGDWVLPANSMWQIPREVGQQVMLENGYWMNLFNLQFYVYDTVPYSQVYFGSQVGQDYTLEFKPLESAVENYPIRRKTDYAWLEDNANYIRTGLRLWRLTIT